MDSRFRLLMTTDVKSEIWDYSLILSKALLKYINAEILMISFGGKPTENQKEQLKDLNINFKFTEISPDCLTDVESNSNISKLKTLFDETIKSFNPHIIHLNHVCSGVNFNKPSVFKFNGNLFNYSKIINKTLNQADTIITSSRFLAENIIKTYNLTKNIKVIYNGVDCQPHSDMPETPTLVTYTNVSDNNKYLNLLLNTAYKLPDNFKIKIIGNSKRLTKLPKNIEFLENLSDPELREVYKNSSIYLALSNYELYGLSSIQAAYSGCAILANNIPAGKELWGDCACLFERDNPNSLMKCINNLTENQNLLAAVSRNCQAKALSFFNSKRMAYEYINLYKNTIKSHQFKPKSVSKPDSSFIKNQNNAEII